MRAAVVAMVLLAGAVPERADAVPKRIVSVGVEDHLCVLGIRPVAGRPGWGSAFRSQVEPCLRGAQVLEWPNGIRIEEQVAALEPDLVLVATWEDPDLIRALGRIAPTLVVAREDEKLGPIGLLRRVAAIVGREAEAEPLIARYEARVAELRRCIAAHPESATIFWSAGRELRMLDEDFLHDTLGIPRPAVFQGALFRYQNPSLEKLAYVDAQHLFVVRGFIVPGSEEGLVDLFATAAWRGLPAVQAGKVHAVRDDYWILPTSVLSQGLVMDDVARAYACDEAR